MVPARTAEFRTQPHNLEAEQALLGAMLVNNEAYHRVSDFLVAEHFFEPVHARIFEVCAQRIGRGQLADPVTLKARIEDDPAFKELGGARYLNGIARAAVPSIPTPRAAAASRSRSPSASCSSWRSRARPRAISVPFRRC